MLSFCCTFFLREIILFGKCSTVMVLLMCRFGRVHVLLHHKTFLGCFTYYAIYCCSDLVCKISSNQISKSSLKLSSWSCNIAASWRVSTIWTNSGQKRKIFRIINRLFWCSNNFWRIQVRLELDLGLDLPVFAFFEKIFLIKHF